MDQAIKSIRLPGSVLAAVPVCPIDLELALRNVRIYLQPLQCSSGRGLAGAGIPLLARVSGKSTLPATFP